ncbi:hypothetical protein [Rhizobium leguminosarum]
MRINKMISTCLLPLGLSGCVEVLSDTRLEQYQSTIRSAYLEQVNKQLAISIDDPYAIPVFINYQSAALAGGAAFSVDPSRTFAPSSVTSVLGITAGPMSSTSTLTAATFNIPKGLKVARDLFAYTVSNVEMDENEKRSLIFPPPAFGWLHYAPKGSRPSGCGNCYFIGNSGKYALYTTSQKSYSDFVILAYQALQLQEQTATVANNAPRKAGDHGPTKSTRPASRPSSITIDPGTPPAAITPSITLPATQ